MMSDPNEPGSVPPPPPTPPSTPATPPPITPASTPITPEGEPTLPEGAPQYQDPTAQMPVTGAAGGMPPGQPPVTGYADPFAPEPETPWYKKPAPLFALLIVLLAIGGLVAWLVLGGDDDDDAIASPESSLLVLEVTDETGAPLEAGFLIEVTGPPAAQFDYTWLQPEGAVVGQIAGAGTGSDGRVEFEWQPAGVESDPDTWAATVSLSQPLPAGWTPPGPIVECGIARADAPSGVISLAAAVDSADPAVDRIVTYTFPNHQFRAGDTVSCRLSSARPPETTIPPATTIEETTTTVADTTTTVAPETTVPVVTVPPQPEATLWDVIDNSPDLSELKALIQLAGLQDVFDDPNATLTLLAPSNQAITIAKSGVGAPDFENPSVVEAVLLTHVDTTQALLFTQLLALDPPEFVPVNPGPHVIDAGANPPTIGEATVLVADVEAANGILHVIDRVLLPQELPE
jgi:uncharacterized surface protein with fasciclin (FAS1) repeats